MKRVLPWLVGPLVAILFLSPVLWMLAASFQPGEHAFGGAAELLNPRTLSLRNYPQAFGRAELGSALVTSSLQTSLIICAGVFVNSAAAYAFARLQFPGRDALFACVIAFVILPIEVLAVPLLLCAKDLGLTGGPLASFVGLTLPFVAKAFNVYFLRQHFLLVPKELEDAAAIDGAGVWARYFRIALPLVKPGLVTVVLLDVLTHWSDFLWPLLISTRNETRTVQLALANLFTQPPLDWGAIMACAALATLPVLLLFRWVERYLVESDARAGLR